MCGFHLELEGEVLQGQESQGSCIGLEAVGLPFDLMPGFRFLVALLVLIGGMLKAESASPRIQGALSLLLLVEDPETHLHPIPLATAWGLMEQLPVQKRVTSAHGALLAGVPTRALAPLIAFAERFGIAWSASSPSAKKWTSTTAAARPPKPCWKPWAGPYSNGVGTSPCPSIRPRTSASSGRPRSTA